MATGTGKNTSVLVVDDEKNIRLGLTKTVESMGLSVDQAATGEEALELLAREGHGLMLLDLRLPGIDGLEVLRRARLLHPDLRVIVITAHGTVESAVEAMKLGAADFIQKPFSPNDIRALVTRVLAREDLPVEDTREYAVAAELARRSIGRQEFLEAMDHVRRAIALDPGRAEAFNLLGALEEIGGDRVAAARNYRAATALDPTYKPAHANLKRVTSREATGDIVMEEET